MGLSLSVVLANAYMEHLEESVLSTSSLKPTIWRRYVDDTFILWPHGEDALQEFHRHLNDFCPSVQFTLEREDRQLPFLDVLLCRDGRELKTSVYRKATTSNVYMNYESNHPPGTKAGVIKCLENRARLLCSDRSSLREERDRIKAIFAANGYPDSFVKKAMKLKRKVQAEAASGGQEEAESRAGASGGQAGEGASGGQARALASGGQAGASGGQAGARAENERASRGQIYAAVPYVPGVSEKISKILARKGIKVAHTSKRLRNRLVHVKDPIEAERRKGAVYQIKCPCGSSYVGESGRPKNVRLKEHIADIKFARTDKSATARHFETCGEDMDPLAAKTLALEGHWKRRKIREAIEIRQLRPSINQDVGTVTLSPIWDSILKNTA